MSYIEIWRMVPEYYHWLSSTTMIARLLLMKEAIEEHTVCPVKLSKVMEEAGYYLCDSDRPNIESKALADPSQHQCDMDTTKVTKLGRVNSSLSCP